MSAPETELSGWGGIPRVRAVERLSENLEQASEGARLSRGLGRSYGDASLPPDTGPACGTRLADRVLAFSAESGIFRAEAGLSVWNFNRLFLPRGWAMPVVPGTQYVTLGGMVASDVHGKNHHVAGCIGEHVRALRIRLADGRIRELSESQEPELFRATLGGLGLTGHVLEVELQLERVPSSWITYETRSCGSLAETLETLRASSQAWPFTVAWIDCTARGRRLGRGFLNRGRWATAEEAPAEASSPRERVSVPFRLPSGLLAPWSIRLFNPLYYHWNAREHRGVQSPQAFFQPLDAIRHWNRIYGRRGMVQYQCVLPDPVSEQAVAELLEHTLRHGGASPVSVIKDCGPEGRGMLSFPRPGVSLALDLPYREGTTQALVDALNESVLRRGGRIYPTKDALTRAEHFRAMEPRLDRFNEVRRKWDPDGRICSALSVRLLGDPA